MAFKTLAQLVTAVETALYQSAGPQVQVYSQDILAQMIQQGFNHVFDKRFWHDFRKREQRTLNGTTGQVTAVLTFINEYRDIQYVFRDGSKRPLPILPTMYNTLSMSGTTPRYIEASGDSKLFLVYPLTSVGDVLVLGRARPTADYAMDEEVEFDQTCLTHYAAWQYFADDGANPASAARHQGLFETRLKTLELADQQFAVQLDSMTGDIPTEWREL